MLECELQRSKKRLLRYASDPIRKTRVVKIVIHDTHRPMTVVKMSCEPLEGRWSRWSIQGISGRPKGKSGVAKLLAAYLQ